MKVLVTGGAGYIGSVVAAELVGAGHETVVFDSLEKGHRAAVPGQARLVVGDISDRAALADLLREGFDAVLHFAAYIEAGESMESPERYLLNNTAGSLALLGAALAAGVQRFVFSSTAAVYGNPQRIPIGEDDPLEPTNPYGESKLLVERMLRWFHRLHGLSYASLRYFNAAGATAERGENHRPESHLIPLVLDVAAGRRAEVTIFGTDYETPDGTCVRDYVHVADVAAAHLLALARLARPAAPQALVYNIGNGQGFSVREVIESAQRVTGRPITVREGKRRPGDAAVLVASPEKIERELNWRPRHTQLEAIIRSAWEWRLRHPEGYPQE